MRRCFETRARRDISYQIRLDNTPAKGFESYLDKLYGFKLWRKQAKGIFASLSPEEQYEMLSRIIRMWKDASRAEQQTAEARREG